MTRKGQTCDNCAGDCCRLAFYVLWPEEMRVKPEAERKEFLMWHSLKELKAYGAVIQKEELRDGGCASQLPNGRCPYDDNGKPPFCKSYYCYGRYWRARETVTER